jgi:hypothetical protein
MQRLFAVALGCAAIALAMAAVASGHDRETNNGVSVTVHIDPDDSPVATQPATIVVERVETRAKFRWLTCRCAWKITDSTGGVVYSNPAKARTSLVFPKPGAYTLSFSGRVKVSTSRWRTFHINYAWRAESPPGS